MVSEDAQVYVISVAAELAGMHPQTLRQYDRLGLVQPGRTRGRGRRYSLRDIATLREVQRLSQEEGVNLAGIKRILELESEVDRLRRQVDYLRAFAEPGRRVFTAHPSGDVVAMGHGQRRRAVPDRAAPAEDPRAAGARGAIVLWRPGAR
jgi:MerR family transcriptional regulator, heat shock protein HspR